MNKTIVIIIAAIVLLGGLYVSAKAGKRIILTSQPSVIRSSPLPEDQAMVADDAQDEQVLNNISADDADVASLSDNSGL